MPSMNIVELFQDEVQFPYGVLPRARVLIDSDLTVLSDIDSMNQ